jgi:transcriptional regulator with XRE-family HTH domain
MINETIVSLRKQKNITQEVLAGALGVSIQAVSKWETGGSYPDILSLPEIAKFFGVPIDYLFYPDAKKRNYNADIDFPNDDKLRIAQFKGKQLLDLQEYKESVYIPIAIDPETYKDVLINVEIHGNAEVKGNINSGVHVDGYVECGNISGGINAGDYVECGNVSGGVNASNYVECGNVSGGINAGGYIECGNVSGGVSTSSNIECGDITGEVHCNGDLEAGKIEGNVEVKEGNINCETIKMVSFCAGNIYCESIETKII